MNTELTRRRFIRNTAVLGAGVASLATPRAIRAANKATNRIVVGVMGLYRGRAHIHRYLDIPNAEIGYVCDVDERRVASGLQDVTEKQDTAAQGITDFRRMLEDKNLDAVSIATPNFWHAPATILACSAGKHVYVEKPGSHNAREGELMVAAARKYRRVVQMGNQRRSHPAFIEGIAKLHEGVIGEVLFARCWFRSARGSIGKGQSAPIPEWLDWT